MKVLIIVNESPWGSTLGVTALRLARALVRAGDSLAAVYFRGEGVYHAQRGTATDAGTPKLDEAWSSLAGEAGFPLLLCRAALQRRFSGPPSGAFRDAGLAEVLTMMDGCDRVVTL